MPEPLETLRERLEPIREGRYLIGLSGGADSVALLLLLAEDIRRGTIRAEAVHVNHGLRGAESDGDELFCRRLCEGAGIGLTVYRADLRGRTDEASARAARFAFFSKRYEEYGADGLILAHHADDQAETFMMRLLRGAGPEGLGCMKNEETVGNMRILRPMLRLRRKEIRDALKAEGAAWREDSSNGDAVYLRNRIRLELFPLLENLAGNPAEKICRAARLIGTDNDALSVRAGEVLNRISEGRILDAEKLAEEHPAVRNRVLRLWWERHAPDLKEHSLSAACTEELAGLLNQRKGRANLPGSAHMTRDGRYLFLEESRAEKPEPVEVTGTDTAFGTFRLTEGPSEGNPGDGKRTQEVPPGFTRGCVIRTRLPGDRIRPFGMAGSKKLQDYFTDRRISEPFRDMIPLLCREQEVLLVCGVGAGAVPGWDREAPRVRLRWEGRIPWTDE